MEQVPAKFILRSPCMRQKNQKVTLPDVPKVKGYTNLGWTTEKGETEPEYSAGDTVKITKATRFYAVRRKSNYYTVSYYLGNGSTNAAYQKLTQTVEEGTVVTFAKVPARTGYVNQGWSSRKILRKQQQRRNVQSTKISLFMRYRRRQYS